jgi:molybdopterin synthase catalytic subunit
MDISIEFTTGPIVPPVLVLPTREIGACVEFLGIVRELEQGAALSGLHYEAHESMAARQLRRIFEELNAAHPCAAVQFIHRLGFVAVGEASLFIRVLASHRGEALRFCAEAIDRMKADVPIWKRA